MADKLTPQQHLAVHDRGGKLLVSAAAGSGKTKVLVDRLMTYLLDPKDPAQLDSFLIITYTKAAASELRGKIAAKLTEKIAEDPQNQHLQKQMQRLFLTKISTVHGFCSDILREYAYRLDIPADFRVADENECRELRDRVLSELLERAYREEDDRQDFQSFVDTQGLGRNDRQIPQIIEKVYDSARCHLDPDGWLREAADASNVESVTDVSETVWGRYLMDDLFAYIDCQLSVLSQCVLHAQRIPEFGKVTLILKSVVTQLHQLREAETWDGIVRGSVIDYGRMVFPKKNPDPQLAERIKAARNACKKGMEKKLQRFQDDSSQILMDMRQASSSVRGLISLVRQFDRDYAAAKKSRHCLDFADLEHKTLELLLGKNRTSPTAAAGEISRRFREIMVDEYQDSNGVQDAIFSVLTDQRKNCFLVGDVKQSIYQFRLADPGIFLEKYRSFVPAQEAEIGQGRKILLSHNFRSGGEIIEAVNDVFRMTMRPKVGGMYYTEAEALREGIPHAPLPDHAVEFYTLQVEKDAYEEEAAFVADRIQTMLAQKTLIRKDGGFRPVEPEDIVILLRSPGSGAGPIRKALDARGIPNTSGNGTDLLQTQEIATVRSLLETVLNPRQDIPLISTLASPVFGFGADDLARIRGCQKKGNFYEAMLLDTQEKTVGFLEILEQLRREAQTSSVTALLESCFSVTRLDSLFAAMPGGDARSVNLQLLYQLAVDYEKNGPKDLAQFLEYLQSLENRGLAGAGNSGSGCVSIMSIHKSKGLEFPVVFLCNLARKFNQDSLRDQILCDKTLGLGLGIADHTQRIRYPSLAKRAIAVKMAAESVSEELRVLYVAMTRARDRLIMTYAPKSLDSKARDTALRMDFDGGALLCEDAGCFGDWLLLPVLSKTEAGELHGISDRPAQTALSGSPWKIAVVKAPAEAQPHVRREHQGKVLPEETVGLLQSRLNFRYLHTAATQTPSKQTATGRKGRVKDEEAAQSAAVPKGQFRPWRKPSFVSGETTAIAYGNAMHAAMQYIRYGMCADAAGIASELERLSASGQISQEQEKLVDASALLAFFQSELGKKLVGGVSCIREFKFSILDPAEQYGEGLEGEQVLLQGVVDCAILEKDGITVLDFKTDRVDETTAAQTAEAYRSQVEAYAQALGRIYEMPVKAKYLYFFRLNRYIAL